MAHVSLPNMRFMHQQWPTCHYRSYTSCAKPADELTAVPACRYALLIYILYALCPSGQVCQSGRHIVVDPQAYLRAVVDACGIHVINEGQQRGQRLEEVNLHPPLTDDF
jgi:hypothetical protein